MVVVLTVRDKLDVARHLIRLVPVRRYLHQTVHKDPLLVLNLLEMTVCCGDNERHQRSQIIRGDHQIGCRINQMLPWCIFEHKGNFTNQMNVRLQAISRQRIV
jgi:hypothetical protein